MQMKKHFTKSISERFYDLFSKFEDCDEEEQKQKIEEMNGLMEEMDEEEFTSIFTVRLLNKIHKMIEEEKLSMGNSILLLKRVGFWKTLKSIWSLNFKNALLNGRIEAMIFEEEKKKDGKNENLLTDLCECYILLNEKFSSQLISICVPFLVKASSNKEKSENVQKDVEMALLSLSNIRFFDVRRELFLDEIKEIIKYQQKHSNLTHLAYQSAWKFLIDRLLLDESLQDVVLDELHYVREETKELNELSKCVGHTSKEKTEETKRKKAKWTILNWLFSTESIFWFVKVWNEEIFGLIGCLVRLCRAAREHELEISERGLFVFLKMAQARTKSFGGLLKNGVFNLILEEILQARFEDKITWDCLRFFLIVAEGLEEKEKDEMEEGKRKATKREIFEYLEEEGYEDAITSFCEVIPFLNGCVGMLIKENIAFYFLNV